MFNKVIYTIYNKTHSEVDYSPFSRLFSLFPFTGKERDEETGYGYFGARYMDHELMTGWLSVDPMADKYPGISPYAYCAWNPVKVIDPNGMDTLRVSYNNKTDSYSLDFARGGDNVIVGPDGKSQKFSNNIDVCQYRFKVIGNNVVSAYMVNVDATEDPIYGFAVEREKTLMNDGLYNMSQNGQKVVDPNPQANSKNAKWQGYMVFKGGNKFHWGNSTEWSIGCVVAVGDVELSAKTNRSGWLTFNLADSQQACYSLTEYFGGQKGDQNYKYWDSKKGRQVTRPAITWGNNSPRCMWEIRNY